MEIKELSFMKNLSEEGEKTSEIDSVIGGHSYSRSYSRSYNYGHSYSRSYSREYVPPSYFVKEIDFDQEINVTESEMQVAATNTTVSQVGFPGFHFW